MNSFQQNVATHEVCIEIGGTPIRFRTFDADFHGLVARRYSGFLGETDEVGSTFEVDLMQPGITEDEEESADSIDDDKPPVLVKHERGLWYMERGDFRAQWDAASRRGRIVQTPTPYATDAILRIVHSLILAGQGGFLLHGASAIRGGKAFLFSGVSGAGKTTISRLAPRDAIVLTDEISYIRKVAGQYYACGTPFAGELARIGENTRAPIQHLFFLAQGLENRVEPVPIADALRLLLRNILFFAEDPHLVECVFSSAIEFLGRVPVSRLTFYPDDRVWKLIG